MRKKVLSGIFALVILLIAGYGVNRSMNSHADMNDLALRNVLALADVENPDPGEGGLDCSYIRNDGKCSIYVGAKGSIKLLGGTIIKANGEGYVIFDGKLSCSPGGTETCRSIECIDLYTAIFS